VNIMVIAGPCAVESEAQVEASAHFLSELGIQWMRGGAHKPRTRPDSFQGLGHEGWRILRHVADKYNLIVVSEVTDCRHVEAACVLLDVLQVGARNAQNYDLLREVGYSGKPVLFKRGLAMTLGEWEGAAEYIIQAGCPDLILCERGHRTPMGHVRFMLDLAAIPLMQSKGYKVIADPSHAAGRKDLVIPLAKAAIAAGADGLIVEVHPYPDRALCDGPQQLTHEMFRELWKWANETR